MGVLVEIRVGGRKLKYFFSHWELSNEKKMSLKIYFLKWTFWPVLHCEYVWFQKRAYYLSSSILIRNIFFHVILGKKHILVHDDIFSKESGKGVPKMCHRTQKKHYRIYIYVAKIWDYALLFNDRFWKQKCS